MSRTSNCAADPGIVRSIGAHVGCADIARLLLECVTSGCAHTHPSVSDADCACQGSSLRRRHSVSGSVRVGGRIRIQLCASVAGMSRGCGRGSRRYKVAIEGLW